MKKNFKITGFSALIFFNILYSIQCLLVCGAMKLLTLILPIDFNLDGNKNERGVNRSVD